MPRINQINTIDITPEKFLNACSAIELHELDLLLGVALARLDEKDYENSEVTVPKLSLASVLTHCFEHSKGISFDVKIRIAEFLGREQELFESDEG